MGLFRRNKVWWMTFIHQGQQVRRSTGTTDRRLADAILGKVRVKIVEGRFFDTLEAKDHTFNDMMDRYLKERSITKAPASRLRDEQCLTHLRSAFGSLNLAEVTPKLLAAYKAKRRETAKPATVNKELGLVRHSFNVAIREWEWCRDNPMQRVCMEKVRNERDRWLSSDEEGLLLAHSAPWLQDIIVFALNTGMRRGESLNLQWPAVDLNRQVLVVMRSKNGEKRTVPLNGRLTELLKRKASKKTAGSFVFASSAETLFDARNLTRAFRLAATKAALSDFRFHDLRHTFATRLAQAGVDLYKVQRLLGHKTAAMTQRYAHHSPESLREGVLILERVHPQISQNYHNEGGSVGGCCVSA
ncbi:MAG: tyrosine-type recombinase/integrase [Nitrospira sp.]